MKASTVKSLQRFVGRVCTVFTTPINRNFEKEGPQGYPQVMFNYFMGRVDHVDEDGILLTQMSPADPPLQSYFFHSHIISIAQEKEYDPSDPNDAKEIKRLESEMLQQMDQIKKDQHQKNDSGSIDPESLNSMIDYLNQQHSSSNDA